MASSSPQTKAPPSPHIKTDTDTGAEATTKPTSPGSSPAPERQVQPQAQAGETATSAPAPKGVAVCGVCETNASKYKCPRCYLPYCSVACNKIHYKNHPPDPTPEPAPEPPSDPSPNPAGPHNPFQALDNSEKLAWLFRKYPNLPQQLLDIHAATQPPPEDPSKQIPASLMQGIPRRNNWSRDKGINRGKAALRRARQLPGEAGQAVREYCTLILLLLDQEAAEGGSEATLQKQFAQQDADIIRQLVEEEKGRS